MRLASKETGAKNDPIAKEKNPPASDPFLWTKRPASALVHKSRTPRRALGRSLQLGSEAIAEELQELQETKRGRQRDQPGQHLEEQLHGGEQDGQQQCNFDEQMEHRINFFPFVKMWRAEPVRPAGLMVQDSSSSLNLSCAVMHSAASMSLRGPRY